jgi:hypothetical protein
MDRRIRQALNLLRASAAGEGISLAHLSDEDLLSGVSKVSREFVLAGRAPALIAVGHRKIGFAFGDLWAAANLESRLPFLDGLRGGGVAE